MFDQSISTWKIQILVCLISNNWYGNLGLPISLNPPF